MTIMGKVKVDSPLRHPKYILGGIHFSNGVSMPPSDRNFPKPPFTPENPRDQRVKPRTLP